MPEEIEKQEEQSADALLKDFAGLAQKVAELEAAQAATPAPEVEPEVPKDSSVVEGVIEPVMVTKEDLAAMEARVQVMMSRQGGSPVPPEKPKEPVPAVHDIQGLERRLEQEIKESGTHLFTYDVSDNFQLIPEWRETYNTNTDPTYYDHEAASAAIEMAAEVSTVDVADMAEV